MIIQIQATNFLNLESFTIDLAANRYRKKAKRLTLLYGENGVGKSSVLLTLDFLRTIRSSITDQAESIKRFESLHGLNPEWIAEALMKGKQDYQISGLMLRLKTIGSDDPTTLVFDGANEECSWEYAISCDYNSVLEESLSINGTPVFSIRKDALPRINDRFIKESILVSAVKDNARMYFGPHSLLACVQHTIGVLAPDYKAIVLDKKLKAVFDEINKVEVFSGTAQPLNDEFFEIDDNRYLNNLQNGIFSEDLEQRLRNTQNLLSSFFRTFSDNIVDIHYVITMKNGYQQYSLHTKRMFASGEKDIPFSRESTGTRELLSLLCVIHRAITANATIAYDEIEAGIHDLALEATLDAFQNAAGGQIIASTQNLRTMKYQFRKAIYVLARNPSNLVYAKPLDPTGRKIQKKSNGTAQYLGSDLAPTVKSLDLQELFDIKVPAQNAN